MFLEFSHQVRISIFLLTEKLQHKSHIEIVIYH